MSEEAQASDGDLSLQARDSEAGRETSVPEEAATQVAPKLASQSDTDIAAEASTSSIVPHANGVSELQRLRDLVFASRGSRAALPDGWEEEREACVDTAPAQAPVPASSVADMPAETTDTAAQKMLQRAISVVGQMASESDSDSDLDSESSESSSASSSSTSQSASKREKRRQPPARDGSSDEEDGGTGGAGTGPTTKNEVVEPTVDRPPYSVVPAEKEIRPLGRVHSVVDCVVVVAQDVGRGPGQLEAQSNYHEAPFDMHGRKGEEEGEYSVLDTGSLLAFADRTVLGLVYETFGSVLSPLYALRYPSAAHVNKDMIQVGKMVSYVPSHSTYVLTRALRALGKGSDASNLWDEEVGDDEREFSDDEAEAVHKRNAKAAKGKGKKRAYAGDEWQQRLPARPAKHGLPMRPAMAPPAHRDADGGGQSIALPYDDDEAASARPPAYPAQGAHAQWAYQQHQQQVPVPHITLPPLRFPGAGASLAMPHYSNPSHYPTPPGSVPQNDSYDPQQPLFGFAQPPMWPPNPAQ